MREREAVYTYAVPDYVPVGKTQKMCMEMLDELLADKFGVHFLEPIVSYAETLKVKPVIRKQFNNAADGRSTPRYLQSLDKRQKPKELHDKEQMSAYQKMRDGKNRPVKLREVLVLEVAKVDKAQRGVAQETAEALEEILQAFEKGYKRLPNRDKFGPAGIKNAVVKENLKKRREERQLEKDREDKRKKRDEQVKNEIKQKEEAKRKLLADTKDERMKKKEAKKKRRQELKAQREKELQQKAKDFEERKQKELEDLERRQKEDEERERKQKEKFEQQNKEFLKQQARKIRKEFKEIVKEKHTIQEAEQQYQEMEQKLKENMKHKMEKFFEENKDSLNKDKEEKQAINKFMAKKAVAAVFAKYDDQLKYYFDHYARSEHKPLTRDIEKEYETLNFKEFKNFAYEANIIPTVVPIQEITYIFNQLVREKQDTDPDSAKALDYEFFKKAIVRISAVGQALLGGQNGPKFEKKMDELRAKEEEDLKKKEALAKKFNATKSPPAKKPTKDDKEDLKREDSADAKQRAKSSKKPERQPGTLMERGAKPAREKVVKPNPKEDLLKNATLLKGKLNDDSLLNKKSHRINKLYEIDNKAQVVDHLKKIKVDNRRIATECDVSIISDKTIEALLQYVGLEENSDDTKKLTPQEFKLEMDKKINQKKLVKTALPTKFKKQNVPDKRDVLDKFDSDSDAQEGEGEEDNSRSKGKIRKDDDE